MHDSESEIKKSLTVTQDLPNDDDAQEIERISTLEVLPTFGAQVCCTMFSFSLMENPRRAFIAWRS